MLKNSLVMGSVFCMTMLSNVHADSQQTRRISQFSNESVRVWKTVIYPTKAHVLKMHRHDSDRVIVALDSGTLKITNDKKETHYLKLEKNKAYFLAKDKPYELHSDENMSHHPIKVMVIELNEKT